MSVEATPDEITFACQGELHPMALKGIELFDAKEYWHAHEALEEAWLDEPGPARHLYRGILQVGVVYLHAQRGNYRGVIKVEHRSRRWLDPFPRHCLGIDVGQLKADLQAVMQEVRLLGPDRLEEFDQRLLRPIVWTAAGQQGEGES
jgi:predicted metal-dependent hydrolase